MLLPKKLSKAGIDVPPNYSDKIGPILLCFGGITYEEREVERLPEIETVEHIVIKKEKKKKKKKEEKDADNEKKEVKPIKVKEEKKKKEKEEKKKKRKKKKKMKN